MDDAIEVVGGGRVGRSSVWRLYASRKLKDSIMLVSRSKDIFDEIDSVFSAEQKTHDEVSEDSQEQAPETNRMAFPNDAERMVAIAGISRSASVSSTINWLDDLSSKSEPKSIIVAGTMDQLTDKDFQQWMFSRENVRMFATDKPLRKKKERERLISLVQECSNESTRIGFAITRHILREMAQEVTKSISHAKSVYSQIMEIGLGPKSSDAPYALFEEIQYPLPASSDLGIQKAHYNKLAAELGVQLFNSKSMRLDAKKIAKFLRQPDSKIAKAIKEKPQTISKNSDAERIQPKLEIFRKIIVTGLIYFESNKDVFLTWLNSENEELPLNKGRHLRPIELILMGGYSEILSWLEGMITGKPS